MTTPGPLHRLKNSHTDDELEQRAAALLRSVGELTPSEARKRRVREALMARPRTAFEWRLLFLRPTLVTVLLTSSVAFAGATVGRGYVSRAYDSVREIFAPSAPTALRLAPHASSRSRAAQVVAPHQDALLAPLPPTEDAETRPPVRHEPSRSERRVARKTPTPASSPTITAPPVAPVLPAGADEGDASLVVNAMKALRHQRDPETAARLLDRYLAAHPAGALAEEAIALELEASLARHDETRAQAFARQYMSRFPAGRFVSLAKRALNAGSP